MFSCDTRTRLDSNVAGRVRYKQEVQRRHHDRHCRPCTLEMDQHVWVRNFREDPQWVKEHVKDRLGPSFS